MDEYYRNDESVKRALEFAARANDRIKSQHPELKRHEIQQRTMAANLAIFNRVYVGSVHGQLRDGDLWRLFSVFGPIKSVQLILEQPSMTGQPPTGAHRGYGFIDFEVPEAAELACRSDGIEVAKKAIKIGRPANFPTDLPPGVPRPPGNRIYIGNVNDLATTESQLCDLLSTIGPVKACHLAPDLSTANQPRPRHRGFGYAEFERVADAQTAVTMLNGFEFCGHKLAVFKSIVGGPLIDGMSSIIQETDNSTKANTCLVLRNVCKPIEIATEKQRNELLQDLLLECKKFGTIVSQQLLIVGTDVVNLYLQYEDSQSLEPAIKAMHNRWFGGQRLRVEEYNLDRYLMRDFE